MECACATTKEHAFLQTPQGRRKAMFRPGGMHNTVSMLVTSKSLSSTAIVGQCCSNYGTNGLELPGSLLCWLLQEKSSEFEFSSMSRPKLPLCTIKRTLMSFFSRQECPRFCLMKATVGRRMAFPG